MDWDDSEETTAPGFLFNQERQLAGARECENERLRLLEENRQLKEEIKSLRVKLAKLVVETNRVRRLLLAAEKKGEVK